MLCSQINYTTQNTFPLFLHFKTVIIGSMKANLIEGLKRVIIVALILWIAFVTYLFIHDFPKVHKNPSTGRIIGAIGPSLRTILLGEAPDTEEEIIAKHNKRVKDHILWYLWFAFGIPLVVLVGGYGSYRTGRWIFEGFKK